MSFSSQIAAFKQKSASEFQTYNGAQEAFDALCFLYDKETGRLKGAFDVFMAHEDLSEIDKGKIEAFYPMLRINVGTEDVNLSAELSHGAFKEEGVYELHVSDPSAYHDLLEQMEVLKKNAPGIKFEIGLSDEVIPFHYAMRDLNFDLKKAVIAAAVANKPAVDETLTESEVDNQRALANISEEREVAARRLFSSRDPISIQDCVSSDEPPEETRLLLPYNGHRFDHARNQFFYYTRTPWEALQPFVIFSNYNQYVEDIFNYGLKKLSEEFQPAAEGVGGAERHVIAVARTGKKVQTRKGYEDDPRITKIREAVELDTTKGAQMPSCHVMMSDGLGISMINTGVGEPNALNISDLIAPKRSHAWFMAGHSAGLSPTLSVGDYVFANQYFANPVAFNAIGSGYDYSQVVNVGGQPAAEIQAAIKKNLTEYADNGGLDVNSIYRSTGVVSTSYRFWERFELTRDRLRQTKAAALDMETSFLAAKANEQAIPFAALLKVSDLPYYDRPKSPAMTDDFFGAVGPHLGVIVQTIEGLCQQELSGLHSRKYREVEGPRAFVFQ